MDQVKDAYIKVRKLNPSETHVICAYKLANRKDPISCDYEDNGEHRGGRAVLKVLNELDLSNKAIFVVRSWGKVKLCGSN